MMAATWGTAGWVAAWRNTEWSVWVGLLLVAVPYAWGLIRLWRHAGVGRGISRRRAAAFGAGVLILFLALTSPLDTMADGLFAAHMTQHLLLIAVVPPLLVLGTPLTAFAWLHPIERALRPVTPMVRATARVATIPIVAFIMQTAVLWLWHLPRLYQAALRNDSIHAVEHAALLGTAMLVWWSALRPRGVRRNGYAIGVLLLLATAMQSGALGALFATARRPWYPLGSTAAARWGLTPLADQQLAGLIMWIPGGILYTVAACGLFLAWIGPMHPALVTGPEGQLP